jgi:RimJ/RimL family protein N-acetyltransferase
MLDRESKGADLPFAVIFQDTGCAIGATRFLEARPDHNGLEIGGTWYGLDFQGTAVNTDTKLIMLEYAFEVLNCIRVQLKTDARNVQSQRAIERLGAVREGTIRKHIICPDGYHRDSIMYSIIEPEWPSIKKRLTARLDRKLAIS